MSDGLHTPLKSAHKRINYCFKAKMKKGLKQMTLQSILELTDFTSMLGLSSNKFTSKG